MTDPYRPTTFCEEAIENAAAHSAKVMSQPFLRQLYGEWYEQFIAETDNLPAGMIIELGAGGGFFKQVFPSVVSTDSLPLPTNDLTFSPESMPFNADSVSGLLMVDAFGRTADTHAFLTEAQRVLKPGGKIIMIEPAPSLWGRLMGRWFCRRTFDRSEAWLNSGSDDPGRVNGAAPWIVFERDRSRYQRDFPRLSVEDITYHTPLRYLVGGGSRFNRAFAPSSAYSFFSRLDAWLADYSPQWSMFMTVVIQKQPDKD